MSAHDFLVESKVAVPCPAHGHLVGVDISPVPAYKRASGRWKHDAALRADFGTLRELTDAIKAAFWEDVSCACPHGDCPFDVELALAWR